jgi:predicted nucleic acid-binding protein
MLLDSTFLNDLVREDPAATETLEQLIADRTHVAISPLTVFEVGIGLRGEAKKHRSTFNEFVEAIEIAPFTLREAWRALDIQYDLHEEGEPIGAVDALIAGTAVTRRDTRVLTRNVDEFQRVSGLTVETY